MDGFVSLHSLDPQINPSHLFQVLWLRLARLTEKLLKEDVPHYYAEQHFLKHGKENGSLCC